MANILTDCVRKDGEYSQLLEKDPGLKSKTFRFSDFPGVETVHRLLKSLNKK